MNIRDFEDRIKDLISIYDTIYVVKNKKDIVAICYSYATALRLKDKKKNLEIKRFNFEELKNKGGYSAE